MTHVCMSLADSLSVLMNLSVGVRWCVYMGVVAFIDNQLIDLTSITRMAQKIMESTMLETYYGDLPSLNKNL